MPIASNNTAGSLWKMGIALPIPNPSFTQLNKIETTLTGTVGSYLQLVYSSGNGWDGSAAGSGLGNTIAHYAKIGDTVLVGPTSAGKIESFLIPSFRNANDINVAIGFSSSTYVAGNKVTILGTNLPGGWHIDQRSGTADATFLTMNGGIKGFDDGFLSGEGWGLNFSKITGGTVAISTVISPESTTRYLPLLQPETVYFLSVHSKATTGPAGGDITLDLYGGTLTPLQGKLTLTATTSWVEVSTTITTDASQTLPAMLEFMQSADAVTVDELSIDNIVCCHARGTDDAASGIYTFDEYAEEGTIRINQPNRGIHSVMLNQFRRSAYPGGLRSGKFMIGARFTDVSQTFWDNLLILDHWQKSGNVLVLQPFLPELPPSMYGMMTIRGVSTDHDLSRRTFDWEFMEV